LIENMALAKYWTLKPSIIPIAAPFIEENPNFEDFILRFCVEADHHSPSTVKDLLRVIFDKLASIHDLDHKKQFWEQAISKKAAKNAINKKVIRKKAGVEAYKKVYIPIAMKYIAEKYRDGTLSHNIIFNGANYSAKFAKTFLETLDQAFATAHPAVAALKVQFGFAPKQTLKDLRLCNLLELFRNERAEPQRGSSLHLLVEAANAAELSCPSARCVLQVLFLPLCCAAGPLPSIVTARH
jgi:hypothetical protein